MNKHLHDAPLCQAFECLRFDSSAATPEMFPVAAHSHYFSEIIFVRSGVCRVTRKGYTHLLSEGELIYIAPMIRHSIESADGKPVQVDLIKFSATRLREIPSYLEGLRALSADAAQVRLPIQVTAEEARFYHMDSIIEECIAETARRDFAWDLHIRALIYLLITAIARFWISRRETLIDQLPQERNPILDVPSYVEEHISESLRVEDLAARCGMSYPWFAKCFHEFFGISCKQFIMRIRVETVEQYLSYSELDLSSISQLTGYTDSSHMVKDFRRITGMTPGQYRNMMKNQGHVPFSPVSGQTTPNHPPKS